MKSGKPVFALGAVIIITVVIISLILSPTGLSDLPVLLLLPGLIFIFSIHIYLPPFRREAAGIASSTRGPPKAF